MRTSGGLSPAPHTVVLSFVVQGPKHGFTLHALSIVLIILGCAVLALAMVMLGNRYRKGLLRRRPDREVLETRRVTTVRIEAAPASFIAEPGGTYPTPSTPSPPATPTKELS